ncbi:MAG: hypothetical protein ACYC0C_12900 [Devosia sp.]
MNAWTQASEVAFSADVDSLIEVVGYADLAAPLRDYCRDLLMPLKRKSVEPMAAPARVAASHGCVFELHGAGSD